MQVVSRKPADAQPQRMGALAKLPVFLDLADKRVVIAGGTAAAAWKAELAAAAGAHVEVYAVELGEEMSALVERGAASGSLKHIDAEWHAGIFGSAALALGDCEDESEAQAFFDAAKAAGVPVNVIDKPKFCQFQFGSIVNRSPVVVAISTDGAAPILGQAIRRRIETLLPPQLAAWGQIAKDLRGEVSARLKAGGPRRRFWEAFAERAFGAPPDKSAVARAAAMIDDVLLSDPGPAAGRVTLVGAGPGDAELLTLKAVRALQAADVILFDDLVSDEVLELARREAKRMVVGKRGKRESCAQGDINSLMIKLAKQGKHVVRLKSGDPMIFGRAGEEIDALRAEGIAVSVVPGITAGLAAASALGVSLTHRDHAHSVRFVTGHSRTGELPDDIDWRGLADPATTLLFYMGGRTAPSIARRLMDQGLAGATPVAVMIGVSRADGQVWHGKLDDLEQGACSIDTQLPVLIGIGTAFGAVAARATEPRRAEVAVA